MLSLWRLKALRPRSLYSRTLLIIILPLVLLQLVVAWSFFDRYWDTMTRSLARSIAGDIAWMIEELNKDSGETHRVRIFDLARRHKQMTVLLDANTAAPTEQTVYDGFLGSFLAEALLERISQPFAIDTSSFKTRVVVEVALPEGVLTVVVPGRRLFSSTTYIFVLWMVGAAIVLIVIALLFMRNQIRPIRRLVEAADAFGKGRDTGGPDFQVGGASEVRQAARAFIRMRDRIGRQIRQRTDMLSGVSHDLRAPLTRMKLELAMLERTEEVEMMESDVADMEAMIAAYLAFARGEGDEKSIDADIAEIVREVATARRREGAKIEIDLLDGLRLPLKKAALARCIDNIVANAAAHGSRVVIGMSKSADGVVIMVDDDGPGISPEEQGNVFRPFYRVDPSRNPNAGGSGLGLTIALDIANAHGGGIELEDSPEGGLRVCIYLPE